MTSDLGFKYSILASGSTGNSLIWKLQKRKIPMDAEVYQEKKITSLLKQS